MAKAKPAAKVAKEVKATKKAAETAKVKKVAPKKAASKAEVKKTPVKKAAVKTKPKEVKDGPTKESSETAVQANNQGKEVNATEKTIAKAGKRSAKAVKETEEKQAKEERKAASSYEKAESRPKVQQKAPRSKLERRSKNFRKAAELIEKGKTYSLNEAAVLATKTSLVKFDATVEMHIRLNVDPRQADQNVRDTVVLPGGTGKTVRVAVFGDAADVASAKKAGADIAGSEEFLQKLDKEEVDFDVLIATPGMMPKLGKYARLLGPKGLMPNPKSGTVTADVGKAVGEAKAGRIEYRVDSTGIVHIGIGKVSFGDKKLAENAKAILASIKANKPSSIKGAYIQSIFMATTMGPSISVDTSEAN